MADITVIGSFVMDMVANVADFPLEGQTILGKKLRMYPGGKGVNQAVAAARLGGNVEMIGCLGSDGNAEAFINILASDNIAHEHIKITEVEPTAVAQIQINCGGENKIVVIPSANYEFKAADMQRLKSVIKNTKLAVIQLEMLEEVNKIVVEMCRKQNVPIMLNPAPAVPLGRELLSGIAYLTPNETELEILTGMKADTQEHLYAAADKLLEYGVNCLIVTLGKRGALLATGHEKTMISGYTVKAVDTVAAGDSFNGAIAYSVIAGTDLKDAVRFANAVGAITVTRHGAIPSLPTMEQVRQFMKQNQLN